MPTPQLEREILQQAVDTYEEHNRNTKLAAEALGVPPSTLSHRLMRARGAGVEPNTKAPVKALGGSGKRVLVIGDLHCPFMHKDAVPFLDALKQHARPDRVVLLGDETDQHALSHWDADPDGYSPGHEHVRALDQLYPLYELFPDAMVCTSNHGARIFKKAYKNGIPRAFLKDYAEFMEAPSGWRWADRFEIDGVVYEHGEGFSGREAAIKSAMLNMKSTTIGHVHSFAGIQYFCNGEKQIFGFNAGCLIDAGSYAFAYGKHHKSKPILGAGVVDKGVPLFFPMKLDEKGRWTGEL